MGQKYNLIGKYIIFDILPAMPVKNADQTKNSREIIHNFSSKYFHFYENIDTLILLD